MDVDYDSGEDSEDDDAFDDEDDEDLDPFSNIPPPEENLQHSDPNSYAWCLMRHAVIKMAQETLQKFVSMAGIELPGKQTFIELSDDDSPGTGTQ